MSQLVLDKTATVSMIYTDPKWAIYHFSLYSSGEPMDTGTGNKVLFYYFPVA